MCKAFSQLGAQWLSGRVLDSRLKGRGFEPHRRHCAVSLRKNINPSLVLVQPRKTRPFIAERLLMGRKESNQTKNKKAFSQISHFNSHLEISSGEKSYECDTCNKPFNVLSSFNRNYIHVRVIHVVKPSQTSVS